jgi:type II secretory pathway pseudopilin PulG
VTLIEVVVGLVILGTLVASVAIARGRAMRQYARAELQLRATRAADTMLAAWFDGPSDAIPLRGGGLLAEVPGCVWRTQPVSNSRAENFNAVTVRFEIADLESRSSLVSVDFLVSRRVSATAPTTRSSRP